MLPTVRRVVAATTLLTSIVATSASATWSIMILDRRTGFIGLAGASCTPDVFGIMAVIPGKAALLAQAIGNPAASREAFRLLREGVAPDSVLRLITSPALDTATQFRQYAMAAIAGGQVQFTGTATTDYHGERSADGILVQGNTLPTAAVLDQAMAAIQRARAAGQSMEDVLMAGLRAGSDAGGDMRCGAQRATSAFLSVAKPGDPAYQRFLTLNVFGVRRGSAVNAVEFLEGRLARWHASGGPTALITSEAVQPDSTP